MAAPMSMSAQSLVFHLSDGAKSSVALPAKFTVTPVGDKLIIEGDNTRVELLQNDVQAVAYRKKNDAANSSVVVDVADVPTIISILTGKIADDDDPEQPVIGEAPADVEAIDLGLPSGTKWANMNVGAEKPEEYGLYFAWGEIVGYGSDINDGRVFDWASYKWCNGSNKAQTKYCINSSYGTVDNITVLELEDDAARANWGGQWVMPTYEELCELINNTTSEWTTQNGINGRKYTSKKNGNSIFLPAGGGRFGTSLGDYTKNGYYWTSSVSNGDPDDACRLNFYSGGSLTGNDYDRRSGQAVRPVLRK